MMLRPLLLLALALAALPQASSAVTEDEMLIPLLLEHSDSRVHATGLDFFGQVDTLLGTQEGAKDGRGSEDKLLLPTSPALYATLAFVHDPSEPGWARMPSHWRRDIRSLIGPGQQKTWERIVVTTDTPGTLTVRWGDLSGVPAHYDLVLLDPQDADGDGQTTLSMRSAQSLSFEVSPTTGGVAEVRFGVRIVNTKPAPIPPGDVDLNQTVDVRDVLMMLRIVAKLVEPTPEQITAGDVDGNGQISVVDALLLLRRLVGL